MIHQILIYFKTVLRSRLAAKASLRLAAYLPCSASSAETLQRTTVSTTLYKIRNDLLAVDPHSVDLERNLRPGKQNLYKVPGGRRSESPIWRQFIFRTVREWNDLPATVAEAGSLDIFKARLAAPSP